MYVNATRLGVSGPRGPGGPTEWRGPLDGRERRSSVDDEGGHTANARPRGALFVGALFVGALFVGAYLVGAYLAGAVIAGAVPGGAVLAGAVVLACAVLAGEGVAAQEIGDGSEGESGLGGERLKDIRGGEGS